MPICTPSATPTSSGSFAKSPTSPSPRHKTRLRSPRNSDGPPFSPEARRLHLQQSRPSGKLQTENPFQRRRRKLPLQNWPILRIDGVANQPKNGESIGTLSVPDETAHHAV